MFDLSNKTALVTGASRGIGQGISDQLAQHGAYVIGTATTDDGAHKITQRFDQLGVKGRGVKLNIADENSINELLKAFKAEKISIDILVNNAGITRDNLAMRLKDDQWDEVLNTNLTGVFKLTRGLLRDMMKKRWGRIITIGSVVGSMGNPGQANYCAAKAAVIGLSKSLAHELASRGITANVVAPGFIQTDMTAELNDAQKQAIMTQVPAQSMGNPEDIAAAAIYLASNEAGYVTGHTLHVNGGLYMA
ncbi:MAG: 3-oxoacyl-ACP reductase FabG [Gammaproteobacteria bacterium]|nr:MAG: 3-oxoacyl-ACP reductase FabG [Gammaproteobacteria bacterium]UTW42297.1 3-oxoacyl-ACP reductase FabG [bacterium SCSIO 12844]